MHDESGQGVNPNAQGIAYSFKGRRVAIFEPNPDFGINPTLCALAFHLRAAGARVDVFMPAPRPFAPDVDRIWPFPRHDGNARWPRGFLSAFNRRELRASLIVTALRHDWGLGVYDLVFAVDPMGMIRAEQFTRHQDAPLIYLSFEIFFKDELIRKSDIEEKIMEIDASQRAAFVIVQDSLRARLLAEENQVPPERMFYLPVAPSGLDPVPRRRLWHEKFSLSADVKVVLHSGSFADWTGAHELLDSLQEWPPEFVLIVHGRFEEETGALLRRRIGEIPHGRIYLSTEMKILGSYEEWVASADIGLVCYKPQEGNRYHGSNIRHIGLASGKFSTYARCGLPIISINQKAHRALFSELGGGIHLQSYEGVGDALIEIGSNFEHYRHGAWRIYRERLAFDNHWPVLMNRLSALMREHDKP